LILLQGPVGVGKTESLKMWSQILGLRQVASPSFAIHHCYSNDQDLQIDHVDLYRTETEDDIDSTGFWDLFSADSGWVVVEWPERILQQHWPLSWSRWLVQMDFANAPDSRSIKIIKQK
jgi:tRNA threonylcarbamoyladenosine biosynthesis protein TsaE